MPKISQFCCHGNIGHTVKIVNRPDLHKPEVALKYRLVYATADEAVAYMFYRCFFSVGFFSAFSVRKKI